MAWTKESGATAAVAGITNWKEAWATSTAYKIGDGVQNDGSSYVCIAEHTSGATTEPGTGASWETDWSLLASKGDAGSGATDNDAIHDNVSGEIAAITEKATLADTDVFIIEDSAASNAKKKTFFLTIKTVLNTFFDSAYSAIGHNHSGVYEPAKGADDNYVTDAEKTVIGNTSGANTGDETTTTLGSKVNSATTKSTPIDADIVGYVDTESSNVIKKLTWTDVKAFLKTYFDTIYQAALGFTAENAANKKTDLSDNSDTYYPSQKAVKTAVDGKMTNPMTTQGDILYGGSSGVPIRLAKGTAGQVLKINAGETAPEWGAVSGTGDVLGPATNSDAYIPQWDGVNSKTLKNGLEVPAGGLAGLTALGDKVDKVTGKGLSTEDYSSAEKTKLSGIEASADVTDAGNVGSSIHGATAKTTMVDADKIAIIDTEASNVLKTLSWAYIKSILKTYFDSIYATGTIPTKATGAELDTGTDDAKFATAKALADSSYIKDIVEDTTPQLGGELDTNNKSINRKSIPGADNTGEGDIVGDVNAGETVAFGNIAYLKTDGKWWLADADAIASSYLLAFILESKNADQAVKALLRGFIRDDDWNWSVGLPVYLSTTAGTLTQTAPTGEDDVVVLVGWATHADRMYFCPDNARIEYKA